MRLAPGSGAPAPGATLVSPLPMSPQAGGGPAGSRGSRQPPLRQPCSQQAARRGSAQPRRGDPLLLLLEEARPTLGCGRETPALAIHLLPPRGSPASAAASADCRGLGGGGGSSPCPRGRSHQAGVAPGEPGASSARADKLHIGTSRGAVVQGNAAGPVGNAWPFSVPELETESPQKGRKRLLGAAGPAAFQPQNFEGSAMRDAWS